MSLYDYLEAQKLSQKDIPFYACIMAAMSRSDSRNMEKLRNAWPNVWTELHERHNAPGGMYPAELKATQRRLWPVVEESQPPAPDRGSIIDYMEGVFEEHREGRFGEVNTESLARRACHYFDCFVGDEDVPEVFNDVASKFATDINEGEYGVD